MFGCCSYPDKVGVLIAQLGTPAAPTKEALRPYLKEFLGDRRVIEKNRFVWWLILNGIILNTRPARSARLYKRIWGKDGSPLLTITKDQTEQVAAEISQAEVVFGMRYGTPSLESAIDSLLAKGVTKVLLFPMYPQYSAATTGSTYDAVFKALLKRRWVPTLKVADPYFNDQRYVRAQAELINDAYAQLAKKPEALVLSYHGIPEEYIEKGDPYCCMCTVTTELMLPLLKCPRESVIHTYQSRFGKDPWLVPYTDVTIKKLAEEGKKTIAVACPGFTADCLETLDELGNEARELFREHGGEELYLIPCLNTYPTWIKAMADIIREAMGNWSQAPVSCAVRCPVKTEKERSGA